MADVVLHSWEYLEQLPGTDFYRLYKNPTSALAVFRKRLSSLAKSFVMFMLYMRSPMTVSDLDLITKPSSLKEKEQALDLLHRYHIFSDTRLNAAKAYQLTENFARSLRQALEGSGSVKSFGEISTTPEASDTKVEDLDRFAREQWEGILGYMVGSSAIPVDEDGRQIAEPSRGVMHLLTTGHLIELSGTASRGYTPKITKEGFAFVLQDINTQVWALLFLYVDLAEDAKGMSKVDVLSFLFLVSSMELGLAYSTANLTAAQQTMLPDLQDFGILYSPPQNPSIFYPTRLATTLTADSVTALSHTATTLGSSLAPSHTRSISTTTSGSASVSGFIILETNFRLYAYTSSPLQIALLALFTNLRSRHPNLVTAKISKHSIRRAVNAGITADQIIAYLTTHAHPQMRRKNTYTSNSSTLNPDAPPTISTSVLPATVIDQIHLWQLERDRMTTTPGFLLKDFQSDTEYETTRKYADEIGVLVWQHDKKRMFFVSRIEHVRSFMAERKERAARAA
jgi:transcription initiation factor TFIIH subunit 4